MRTISVNILDDDYEAYRKASKIQKRPIAQMIREAMSFYRREKLEAKPRLKDLPILIGHRPISDLLPGRDEIFGEIFQDDS